MTRALTRQDLSVVRSYPVGFRLRPDPNAYFELGDVVAHLDAGPVGRVVARFQARGRPQQILVEGYRWCLASYFVRVVDEEMAG